MLVLPSWNHRQLIVWVGWTLLDSVGSQTSSQIVGINSTTVNQWELQAEGHLFFFLVLSLLPLCVLPFFPLHYILFCLHILFKIILFVPMVSPVPTSLETPAGLHEWSFMFRIAQTQWGLVRPTLSFLLCDLAQSRAPPCQQSLGSDSGVFPTPLSPLPWATASNFWALAMSPTQSLFFTTCEAPWQGWPDQPFAIGCVLSAPCLPLLVSWPVTSLFLALGSLLMLVLLLLFCKERLAFIIGFAKRLSTDL